VAKKKESEAPRLRSPLRWGWGVLAAWLALAAVLTAAWHLWPALPERWNPWAPLRPLEAPNLLTAYKLARVDRDPAACAAALAGTALVYAPVPDRPVEQGCGWSNAVRVSAVPARLGAPVVLSCPAAVSLAMWERHGLQPQAAAHFGRRVAAIEHAGSFACRDIGSRSAARESGRRSEHATANAFDVAGFVLDDGRRLSVAGRWADDEAEPGARFLRAVHADACRWWHVVLGPRYDAAHRDHFHLDRGRGRSCR
jgi:hypothetical protein